MLINNRYILLFVLSFSFCSHIYAQDNTYLKIQQTEIGDTLLKSQIEKYIQAQTFIDTTFKVRGYIEVFISNKEYKGLKTQVSYRIIKDFLNFDDLNNDLRFPLFYSWVKNRIVLFYSDEIRNTLNLKYSTDSKRAFQKIIEPFLFPGEDVYLTIDGVTKKGTNFRPNEIFMFGGPSVRIYKLYDNSVIIDDTPTRLY